MHVVEFADHYLLIQGITFLQEEVFMSTKNMNKHKIKTPPTTPKYVNSFHCGGWELSLNSPRTAVTISNYDEKTS